MSSPSNTVFSTGSSFLTTGDNEMPLCAPEILATVDSQLACISSSFTSTSEPPEPISTTLANPVSTNKPLTTISTTTVPVSSSSATATPAATASERIDKAKNFKEQEENARWIDSYRRAQPVFAAGQEPTLLSVNDPYFKRLRAEFRREVQAKSVSMGVTVVRERGDVELKGEGMRMGRGKAKAKKVLIGFGRKLALVN